jgi:hypothetical protein
MDDLRLEIDELRLREEWQGQPLLVLQWTERQADAVLDTDRAKATYELAKAKAGRDVRDDPSTYGLAKLTEGTVAGAVTEHPDVRGALAVWHEAKHRAAVLAGVVSAIEDRRRALQKIVELESREYFSDMPRGVRPRGGSDG